MLIISNKPGQLGNRIWVFAHLMAYAIEHNHKIYNPAFDEYSHLFEGTKNCIIPSYPQKKGFFSSKQLTHLAYGITNISAKITRKLNLHNAICSTHYLDWTDSFNLDKNKFEDKSALTFLSGWLYRGEKILDKHQEEIREYFLPAKDHRDNVNKFIDDHKNENDILIGIHIRRGDYKTFENGKYFFEIEFYNKIMLQIQNFLAPQKVKFIICSNETITPSQFTVRSWYTGPGHYFEDLLALAECDFIIGPPSTFSLWASFYGKKKLFQLKNTDLNTINKELNALFEN